MSDDGWYGERDDRMLRYAGRRLDQSRWIAIRVEPVYARRYAGQVAVLTAANLLGRMSPSVALDLPDVPIVEPLPWAGQRLGDFALARLYEADPRGRFCARAARDGDYLMHLGGAGADALAHGEGWLAYLGPPSSPLPACLDANPIGPALASILAATRLFVHNFAPPAATLSVNALNWSHGLPAASMPALPAGAALGEVWTVGAGSVGTAILYFLTLATRNFSAALFDMDRVKRVNITRSPIFTEGHVGAFKSDVAGAYLKACGVSSVLPERCAFDQSARWANRQLGTPDLLVAAANERNVRHLIESLYPPLQIYGTTGRNWQAAAIRHVPLRDACSCCLFPAAGFRPTECATDPAAEAGGGDQIDASLPFLSFAAGLMAAAEILKLALPGYPFSANRAYIMTQPDVRLVTAASARRPGCACAGRSEKTHLRMIEGSRFASLSAAP